MKILVIIAFAAAAIVAQPPQPLEPPLFQEVYLAKDDGTGNPGEETTEFAPTDIPIHCVVLLGSGRPVTVKMDLLVVSVAGVRAETKVVSTSFTTKDLEDRVLFNGRPRGQWIAGTYRADIYIDGVLAGKFPFRIKGGVTPVKPVLNFQPKQRKQPVKPRSATAKKT